MRVTINDLVVAREVHGEMIRGTILKVYKNTLVVLSGKALYVVRKKELMAQGYTLEAPASFI